MNNFEKIQELLKEEYEKLGKEKKYESFNKEMNVQDIYIDTATIELIKWYDSKYKADIQAELKAYLEPTIMEKLRAYVDGKDIQEIKKNEQKEIERTISSSGISVDNKTKEEVQKEVDEKNKDEIKQGEKIQEENLRALVLKTIYKSVLEDYYRLKQNIQESGWDSQIATGSLSTTDKIGTELVLYEKYLKDIDERYKNVTGIDIIRDDDEIKKFEEELVIHDEKNETAILNKNDDNMSQIIDVYERRNSLATEIANLSSKANIMDTEKFNQQMDILQNEYTKLSAKLYNLTPNPLDVEKNIEQMNKDESYREKQIGRYRITHINNLGMNTASKVKENDVRLESDLENKNEQINKSDNVQEKSIDIIIKNYEEAESRGNYQKAEELLQSLEKVAGIQAEEFEESNNGKVEEKTPEEIQEKKEEKSLLFDPRLSATNDETEVATIEADKEDRKQRFNRVIEKLNIKREEKEVKVQDDYVPTLQNKKRGY